MKNLLLFRLGGLGDLLVAFPSIYLLRKALSPCMISLVCQKEYGMLLKDTGVVDELISEDDRRLIPFFSDILSFETEFKNFLQSFDGIMGWMQKKSAIRVDKSWIADKRKNFCPIVYRGQSRYQVSRFFFHKTKEFLVEKGEKSVEFSECIILPFSSAQKEEGWKLLEGRVSSGKERIMVVHPGSGSREKCWPLTNYLTLIHRLSQQGLKGVLVTGVAEQWMENEIEKSERPRNWLWLKSPSLLQLAGLLSQASFYLGNDSGITHLAAACGAKGLALFRKDMEASWKLYGQVRVLSGGSLSEIGVEEVWGTLQRKLK